MSALHLPSYELGKLLARIDFAASSVKDEDGVIAAALVIRDDEVPGCNPEFQVLFPSSLREGYDEEIARHTAHFNVGVDCPVCKVVLLTLPIPARS